MKQGVAKVGQYDQRAAQALIIFTKVPTPGQVKTRLIPLLTPIKAAELQKCFLLDILDLASEVKNCDLVVAYMPPEELSRLKDALRNSKLKFIPQRGKDIGERMCNAFRDVFEMGYERIVLVGTDLPTLPLRYLDNALGLLGSHDIVLGPNVDGGYYLIGMKSPKGGVFKGVAWGTEKELSQTLSRIHQDGLKLACLDVWYDVDTAKDLKFLKTHLEYLKTCGDFFPKRTYKVIKRLKL